MVARFDELLNVVKADLKGIVPYSENITSKVLLLSNRNKGTLGRCTRNRENTKFTISLNPKLKNMSEQLIKDVLAHEIIHTAKGCFGSKFHGVSTGDRLSPLPYFPGGIWECSPMMLRFPLRRAIDNRPYLITDGISEPCDLLYDCLLKVVHCGVHACHREHNSENNCADDARHKDDDQGFKHTG